MSDIETGGCAFPGSDSWDGMNMRQYYAGQALAGFCANPDIQWTMAGVGKHIAQQCWKQADAMIAEGDKS